MAVTVGLRKKPHGTESGLSVCFTLFTLIAHGKTRVDTLKGSPQPRPACADRDPIPHES
jgi:hypothetical protein